MKKWKKYQEVSKLFDKSKTFNITEAVSILKKVSYTKFDWTVEITVKTNANPKYNDQMIRSTIILPNWTWKTKKVAVYVTDEEIQEAQNSWADIVWTTDFLEKIKKWELEFDVLLTTPTSIRNLAQVAKILWPKWLMPSPKSWTVLPIQNLKQSVSEFKKWKVEFKLDKTWNISIPVWKISFDENKIVENIETFLNKIKQVKPSWVKWKLIKKIYVAPTMWPSIQIEYSE